MALSKKTAQELLTQSRNLIGQLRRQAQLAREFGGDIALAEGNGEVWKKAEAAITKAEEELKKK